MKHTTKYNKKISKRDSSFFNSMADERIMAMAEMLKSHSKIAKYVQSKTKCKMEITFGEALSHIHAVVFNGLVDAYKLGKSKEPLTKVLLKK